MHLGRRASRFRVVRRIPPTGDVTVSRLSDDRPINVGATIDAPLTAFVTDPAAALKGKLKVLDGLRRQAKAGPGAKQVAPNREVARKNTYLGPSLRAREQIWPINRLQAWINATHIPEASCNENER